MSATFELNCPHCDRLYTLSLEKALSLAGRSIRCKECGQPFRLPSEGDIRASAEATMPAAPAATGELEAVAGPPPHRAGHEDEGPVSIVSEHPVPAPAIESQIELPASDGLSPAGAVEPDRPPVATIPTPQVIYAMPPQTVTDIATIRKWAVVLGVLGLLLVTVNAVVLVLLLVRNR